MTHQEKTVNNGTLYIYINANTCSSKLRQEVLYKGLIDNRCHALEAVPERRAIHKLNAIFFLQKIKSACKYLSKIHIITIQPAGTL